MCPTHAGVVVEQLDFQRAFFGAHGAAVGGLGVPGMVGAAQRRFRWLTLFHIRHDTWGAWLAGLWGNVAGLP